MFSIEPHAFYSKRELAAGLKQICDVDRLLDRIRPKYIIRGTYWGADVIEAIKKAPDYRDIALAASKANLADAKASTRSQNQKWDTAETARIGKSEV